MNNSNNIKIVGDFTNKKPYMIIEYIHGKNNYIGHKVLSRFKEEKEANKYITERKQEDKK